ncbi:hypothetical protein NEPAR06_0335 [Nematocida parisii]|uniref:Uncharacterized protein n=1 Tax=Nematocida parisii (strain ERTm3) TaxID=935791 RepID=I3EGB2_NEMP3|nr:uncharacterized protein NEPG_01247 [Nematocida parisii ERTm1]EIJ88259.1 hypothetical protein NEQG_01703 [Nematocida parisii ERTm3]KAI5142322.1 hypothetical protein NEPAR07_0064 [Nematocida parisii]EIJ93675.1 hypothetical protein NEPG_01247 [Nematocida parisii ERTm1]KAI5153299.1 hypothetical protein NEPAR06_0335 [Nematocida parisii]KAI5155679.1 hypothetical protein NEPAR05_0050 [Nematocida parisii]|eukprot:XP_013059075.1 hypothetical protein NEPG_01247 [Nematocida parisii ERTm1]
MSRQTRTALRLLTVKHILSGICYILLILSTIESAPSKKKPRTKKKNSNSNNNKTNENKCTNSALKEVELRYPEPIHDIMGLIKYISRHNSTRRSQRDPYTSSGSYILNPPSKVIMKMLSCCVNKSYFFMNNMDTSASIIVNHDKSKTKPYTCFQDENDNIIANSMYTSSQSIDEINEPFPITIEVEKSSTSMLMGVTKNFIVNTSHDYLCRTRYPALETYLKIPSENIWDNCFIMYSEYENENELDNKIEKKKEDSQSETNDSTNFIDKLPKILMVCSFNCMSNGRVFRHSIKFDINNELFGVLASVLAGDSVAPTYILDDVYTLQYNSAYDIYNDDVNVKCLINDFSLINNIGRKLYEELKPPLETAKISTILKFRSMFYASTPLKDNDMRLKEIQNALFDETSMTALIIYNLNLATSYFLNYSKDPSLNGSCVFDKNDTLRPKKLTEVITQPSSMKSNYTMGSLKFTDPEINSSVEVDISITNISIKVEKSRRVINHINHAGIYILFNDPNDPDILYVKHIVQGKENIFATIIKLHRNDPLTSKLLSTLVNLPGKKGDKNSVKTQEDLAFYVGKLKSEYEYKHLITSCSLDIANGCAPEPVIKLIVEHWKSPSNSTYGKNPTNNKYQTMSDKYFPNPHDRVLDEYKFILKMCSKLKLLEDIRFQNIYIRKIIDKNFKNICELYSAEKEKKDSERKKIAAKRKEETTEDLENNQTIENPSKENQLVLN